MTYRFMRSSLAALLLVAACSSATEAGAGTSIAGAWHYTGMQTNSRGGATTAQLSGTLDIRSQRGDAFDGTLAITATDAQGVTRVIQGIVAGSFASPRVIDFDLDTGDETMRHVGTLSGDTISGSWASTNNASAGTFRAVRER